MRPTSSHQPLKQSRIRNSLDDPNYARLDDPLIAYFGFRSEDHRQEEANYQQLPKTITNKMDINNNNSNNNNMRINRNDVKASKASRVCRRRFPSYTEKIAARNNVKSEYKELLKAKQRLRSTGSDDSPPEDTYSTTDNLSEVLESYRHQPSPNAFVHLDSSSSEPVFPIYLSTQESIEEYVKREAQLYREAKLYKDIETKLIEMVAVIERIGLNNRDWRHSVVHINEADRINLIASCALELDALNKTKHHHKNKKVVQQQNDLPNAHDLNFEFQFQKRHRSLKEKLKRSFRHKQKPDHVPRVVETEPQEDSVISPEDSLPENLPTSQGNNAPVRNEVTVLVTNPENLLEKNKPSEDVFLDEEASSPRNSPKPIACEPRTPMPSIKITEEEGAPSITNETHQVKGRVVVKQKHSIVWTQKRTPGENFSQVNENCSGISNTSTNLPGVRADNHCVTLLSTSNQPSNEQMDHSIAGSRSPVTKRRIWRFGMHKGSEESTLKTVHSSHCVDDVLAVKPSRAGDQQPARPASTHLSIFDHDKKTSVGKSRSFNLGRVLSFRGRNNHSVEDTYKGVQQKHSIENEEPKHQTINNDISNDTNSDAVLTRSNRSSIATSSSGQSSFDRDSRSDFELIQSDEIDAKDDMDLSSLINFAAVLTTKN